MNYEMSDTLSSYSIPWMYTRAYTRDLQDPFVLAWYTQKGYKYIRRYTPKSFRDIVRYPTVGCCVEMSALDFPGSIPIDSWKGRQLIKKLCFF